MYHRGNAQVEERHRCAKAVADNLTEDIAETHSTIVYDK
jgi:hypothetical protein